MTIGGSQRETKMASCEEKPLLSSSQLRNPLPNVSPELWAKLAPNRVHESNWLKTLLCNFGWHRWYHLDLGNSIPAWEVSLCRWCPKVKVGGVLYGG